MELTAEKVKTRLAPRWNAQFFERVDSTNEIALKRFFEKSWLQLRVDEGDVIVADEQLKGKGRLGRTWYTPLGTSLIVSVILPLTEPKHLPRITMLGAVVIAEMIEQLGVIEVGIKWPNDVQLNSKKVSGVLSEARWMPGGSRMGLRGVVLGMGVNVRIDFSGTELAETAISIEPALGRQVDRLDLLADLMARVDYWYGRIGSAELFDAWKSRLNMLGKMVTVQQGTIHGLAESVDESGALKVRDHNGVLQRVIAGDIALGS
jgi:BirA family transcriptional regulator, biotin operon repressor / biotin---[acetyl-CoA-carboxylase] ligase